MFEERNPIFRFIFKHSYGWAGKLAASTIIGALAFGLGGLEASEKSAEIPWQTFVWVGGALGFMAALILVTHDLLFGVDIDHGTQRLPRVSPGLASALLVSVIVGCFAVVVFGFFVISDVMKHAR